MRNLKKFLALVLAMMMVFSLMITANAATGSFDDSKDVIDEFVEAVEVMNGTGIMVGDGSGNFNPEGELTRAEAVVIMYHIITGDVENEKEGLTVGYGEYEDVPANEWYAGYVGFCTNAGIIQGDGEGHFFPYSKVTGYEMLAMLLRAIGYKELSVFSGTDWRMQVASGATSLRILDNVNATRYRGNLGAPARRQTVAEMTFQTIQKPQSINGSTTSWTAVGGQLTVVTNETLAEKWFGLKKVTGVIVGNQATGESDTLLGVEVKAKDPAEPTISGVSYLYDTDTATDFDDSAVKTANATLTFDLETGLNKFGHKVDVWYDHRSNGDDLTVGTTNPVTLEDNFGKVYCAIDKSTSSVVVYSGDSTKGTNLASEDDSYTSLGEIAKDAGFSVKIHATESGIYESDAYTAMALYNSESDSGITSSKGDTGAYLLISNGAKSGGKDPLNVVVALKVSVELVTARNEYTNPKSVTLSSAGEIKRSVKSSNPNKTATDGKLLVYGEKNITVGAVEVANKIWGTELDVLSDVTFDNSGNYYGIDKVTKEVSGKVVSLTNSGKVTLDTGDVLEQSALWNVTPNVYSADKNELMIGATLTFHLDGYGKYLGVSKAVNDPFMGAYGYWEQTGISGIKYYIQGVTRKGVEVREEIDQKTYQDMFTDATNKMPFLSTTIKDESSSTSTSLSVTPKTTNTMGYQALRVTDKTGDEIGVEAGWNRFAAGDGKHNLSKGDDRWHDNTNNATYFLRDDTVYHVVTGSGDNLKIEHFTGLNALLQGADSIQFNGYFFVDRDDTEHVANKNYVVEEALLVNVKRISSSSFFFNLDAEDPDNTANDGDGNLKKTVDGKAAQYTMYVAGQGEDGYVLLSRIGDKKTRESNGDLVDDALTADKRFYLASLDGNGYYELDVQDNSDPAAEKTYAYYSSEDEKTVDDDTGYGALAKGNTAFGEIRFKDLKNNVVTLKAENAKVFDVTGSDHGIEDYASLRRAAEENEIQVAVLVTTAGGNIASVVYVTGVTPRT